MNPNLDFAITSDVGNINPNLVANHEALSRVAGNRQVADSMRTITRLRMMLWCFYNPSLFNVLR